MVRTVFYVFLGVFGFSVAAGTVYPPSALMENGKNAGIRGASFRPGNRERNSLRNGNVTSCKPLLDRRPVPPRL